MANNTIVSNLFYFNYFRGISIYKGSVSVASKNMENRRINLHGQFPFLFFLQSILLEVCVNGVNGQSN